VLKQCAANRKRLLSVSPNVGPYINDVKISGFTRISILHKISRLRVKGAWTGNKRIKFDRKHPGAGNSKFLTVIKSIPRHAEELRVADNTFKLAQA
jgi:hypothetical protein